MLHSVTRPATWAGTVHHRGKGTARTDSSHSPGFSGFAGMLFEISTSSGLPSFAMALLLSDRFSGFGIWDSGVWISGARGNPRLTRDFGNEGFLRDRL